MAAVRPADRGHIREIRIDANGRISHHIDHWDSASQLLMVLPVIRAIIRPVMRLFRIA